MKKEKKPEKTPKKPCGLFDIYPNVGVDTCDGKTMDNGVMFISIHAATATIAFGKKPVEIQVSSCLDGTTLLYCNGRLAKVNLEKLINAAVESGLLDKVIDFTPYKGSAS